MLAVSSNFERYLQKMGLKILIVDRKDLKNYVLQEYKKSFIVDEDTIKNSAEDKDSEFLKSMYYALSRYIDKMKNGMEKEKIFQPSIINTSYSFEKYEIEPFLKITFGCFISLKEIL